MSPMFSVVVGDQGSFDQKRAELGFGHDAHPLPGRRVRDVASGTEGEPMAVVREEVTTHSGPRWTRRASNRPEAGGRELPTAVGNIAPLEAT
ncbi:hypothetical protein AB0I68_33190 [Streptomyces sp. NPDC050448]|uniref:hypothetical protein n=1 Tax=Streptomyces sp. NPDC050448 TaxID=3155404 RepID=UPI00342154E9